MPKDIINNYLLQGANAVWTPLPANAYIGTIRKNDITFPKSEHSKYRSILSELLYLSVFTRPDLEFNVSAFARRTHNPTLRHMYYQKRVLRYLVATTKVGISYTCNYHSKQKATLTAFVYSDWPGCCSTRKSPTRYIETFNGSPISWKGQQQNTVAFSSAEAYYIPL